MSFDIETGRKLLRDISSSSRTGDDEKALLAFRREILGSLKKAGFDLSKTPAKPKKKLVWDDRFVLVVAIDDHQYDATLYAVPVSELPDSVGDAVQDLNGSVFAGPQDLSLEEWSWALRVGAAMGASADPKRFYEGLVAPWNAQFKKAKIKAPSLKEIRDTWNCVAQYELGSLDAEKPIKGLEHWFSSAFAYCRAM